MKTKQAQLDELVRQAKSFRKDLETRHNAGEEITQEERNNLQQMIDDGKALRAQIEQELELDSLDEFVAEPTDGRQTKAGAPVAERPKSWGHTVIESKTFKAAHEAGDRIMAPVQVKELHGVTAAAGGALVVTYRDPEMVGIPMQPRSILDLITIAQTNSNSVEFARMLSRTNNAAVVAEHTGADFGTKPESTFDFELVQAAVKTIPTYIAASRNILADAPQLRSMIDDELTYMVRLTLENQLLNGDGTGQNFTGILATSGIQTRTQADIADRGGLASDTKADALRRAITDIQLSFYEVSGMLLNPGDGEAIELEKDANGNYINLYDAVSGRLWRTPVVESPIIAAGTALVGNFRMGATMYDRQQTDIRVGEPNDYFLKNAVAVLAELRAAFAVKRPAAFEEVTFV